MMRGFEDCEGEIHNSDRTSTEMSNGGGVASSKTLTLLDRLRLCQSAWAPSSPWTQEAVHTALWGRQPGSFLVLLDSMSCPQLLCVSVGGHGEPVKDFPIHNTGAVLHLSESHLGFSDLDQLVAFYSLSRDVLPVCLFIPPCVFSFTEQPEVLSSLGPKFWLCSSLEPSHLIPKPSGLSMCSIQVTSANGALCIINPLYLHEHGDNWLMEQPSSKTSPLLARRTASHRRERRLSTTRTWQGAGLRKMRGPSLDQEPSSTGCDGSVSPVTEPPASPSAPVVLRRSSQPTCDSFRRRGHRGSTEDIVTSRESTPLSSPVPQSPHRVSWIEDGVWMSHPPLISLLHPPSLELDSLSISSLEEESDSIPSPAHTPTHRLPLVLADKVKHRLSAVGQVIGGLMSPQRRLTYRVQELSERKSGAFAEGVRAFVEKFQKGGAGLHPSATELLQEVRATLTSLRELLLDGPEIQALIDSMGDVADSDIELGASAHDFHGPSLYPVHASGPSEFRVLFLTSGSASSLSRVEKDAMLELAIHKVLLKPVQTYLYASLLDYRNRDGSMQCLKENQNTMGMQNPEALGAAVGVGLPDTMILEKIQQRWASMHQAYSPIKKVQILLKVCKSIYHSMSANSSPGAVYGADDFLPCLTWVILRSDISTLQLDTDYMMELLDPAQLQGEGGYYLTSVYGSLFHISSFRSRFATRQLSTEAQRSLSQWHRRRTLHCNRSRRTSNRRTIWKPSSREGVGPQTEAELQDRQTPPDSTKEEHETRVPSVSQVDMHHKAEGGLEDVKEEEDSRPEGPAEESHGNTELKSAERGPESEETVEALRMMRDKPTKSPKERDGRPWSEPRGHEVLWAVHEDTGRDLQDKKKKALSRLSN